MSNPNTTYSTSGNGAPASREFVVGLDIGTTKVVALIASPDPSAAGGLSILGVGSYPSEGLNRGVVVNIEKTVRSIQQAVEQAEAQSGVKVRDVVVGIAGDHIQSFQTRSIVAVSSPTQEIHQSDVDRLLDDTRKIAIPSDRRILHVIPQDFIIDGQDGITDPVGMSGVRMEANVHVVTGLVTAMQNIFRCVERAGLRVRDLVLEPLASSYACLDDAEKEVGVALVDIGGGTTDIAIFEENIIRHTAVIGIAGRQVTDDIRKGLGIISQQAERIKQDYGHATPESILRDEVFMIPGVGGRNPMEVSRSLLCQIIEPRLEELFEFVLAEIRRSGYEHRLSAGVVITGGASLVRGTDLLAHRVLGMPVKVGFPSGVGFGGLSQEVENPIFSTAVGLALYALRTGALNTNEDEVSEPEEIAQEEKARGSLLQRFKDFFGDL